MEYKSSGAQQSLHHGAQLRRLPIPPSRSPSPCNCERIFSIESASSVSISAANSSLAVGAADAKLLHFEAAAELDDGVEDLLHDVGIDEVPLGLHALLQRWQGFGLRFQFCFQITGYPLLEGKLDFEAGKWIDEDYL